MDNRRAASKLIREIEERFATVQAHPEIGPRRERLAAGLRAHFHRDYVLYYRFTDEEVIIVRVVHGARDVRALTFGEGTQ
ncbi:type II toxin-antitoxin system RelE/ParE family toxin [Thiocapsa sp.]|uniref:type II toxin-antitoxin system RelE/ParE family toxin n=1 Tax=Thiocapsa sp. TaxID=2024551 RepID=UPI00261EDBE0|nr:type II toxin-antitoxin system RelE/ParE family toxin [Thiocapsa sp.]